MTGLEWLGFLVAAAVGAPTRYLIDGWIHDRAGGAFPWGTLAVNISGCLALGFLTGLVMYHGTASATKTMVGTGGLGAYTTFSTFTFETVRLAEEGAVEAALRNVAASVVIGMAAATLGLAIAGAIP